MVVIFYSPEMDGKAEAVRRVIEGAGRFIAVEAYRSIDSLGNRIMRPLDDVVMALIRPSLPADLEEMMEMKDRFAMLDVIVMSDGEIDSGAGGIYELRPRFVFNIDDNPEVVGLILKKMVKRKKRISPIDSPVKRVEKCAVCGTASWRKGN